MQVSEQEIARICIQFGPQLNTVPSISRGQLLWAIAGNESLFGDWCPPRHERGYHYGSRMYRRSKELRDLTKEWGCLAHCSFGPWQVMLVNAPGFSPIELMADAELACKSAVDFLNRVILGAQKASTLEEIADAYNSGNFRDDIVPHEYIARLKRNYKVPMPVSV
jgi:hypothetical protein